MKNSKIGWTTHTFNPWWGCVKIAPECKFCYAGAHDARIGGGHWGKEAPRRLMSDKYWLEPILWDRRAAREANDLVAQGRAAEVVRPRVFCASMADVFEDRPDLMMERERLWHLIRDTPALDWLLLTKRPETIETLLIEINGPSGQNAWHELAAGLAPNVWVGTSVGCRASLPRVEALRRIPATVRFLSMEPLLEEVVPDFKNIDWVIIGGESGFQARPFHYGWAREILAYCEGLNIPVYVKQMGRKPFDDGLDFGKSGESAFPVRLEDKAGADWDEWPEDLRIRQFPERRVA